MIKIWKVKVKLKNERGSIPTIGIEEEKHELILWKHWVDFAPEHSFFHSRFLRHNYGFMQMLLRIANYYVQQKREDKSVVYAANIIGISPYLLGVIAGYESHGFMAKLRELASLGYIDFTQPTEGRRSEMNILLNEYTKDNHLVFHIAKNWLNENLVIDKVEVIEESEDGKKYQIPVNLKDTDISKLAYDLPIPIDGISIEHVDTIHKQRVGKLQDKTENLGSEFDVNEIVPRDSVTDAGQFEGVSKELVEQLNSVIWGKVLRSNTEGNSSNSLDISGTMSSDVYFVNREAGKKDAGIPDKGFPDREKAEITSLSTWGQVVAVFYEKETGLPFTTADIDFLNELLKISGPTQIISAIKTARIWRQKLPNNFTVLSENEKKRCIMETQPGYWLKKNGLKHVYNFVKNTPRYRKDMKRGSSTGVVSGLDEERAKQQQKKILDDIKKRYKEKQQKEKEADGK